MNHASLATRYRPQTFAEVVGQDIVKTILSNSAARDRVAPAYLLSGTRGVGKTTVARIFAKALNCRHAPAAEPCNMCDQCRSITSGNYIDVVEIDGASNRGIEDARRLRELTAYPPMMGRYKIFIIDEAHMLTRESFNALLKTLEEPPERFTFIFATTEAHKFPVTITSRCQHLVFKAIPEAQLAAHLINILHKEGIPFEEGAVRLLARRGAGSVRDSMSLLGQTLALGGDTLTESATRTVLGLAGPEMYERLLYALKQQDCIAVLDITRELLARGVDLGFFLRELATLWRNLFLIHQIGAAVSTVLDIPETEKTRLMKIAPQFDITYIHAAWQMVLESQRQILNSLEPASALELLLLNMALLPRLVSLEQLSRAVTAPPAPSAPAVTVATAAAPETLPAQVKAAPAPDRGSAASAPAATATPAHTPTAAPAEAADGRQLNTATSPQTEKKETVSADSTWSRFLTYVKNAELPAKFPLQALQAAQGTFTEELLTLAPVSSFQYRQLTAPGCTALLDRLAADFAQRRIRVDIQPPENIPGTEAELKKKFESHPVIKSLLETFDASLLRCRPLDNRDGK